MSADTPINLSMEKKQKHSFQCESIAIPTNQLLI